MITSGSKDRERAIFQINYVSLVKERKTLKKSCNFLKFYIHLSEDLKKKARKSGLGGKDGEGIEGQMP